MRIGNDSTDQTGFAVSCLLDISSTATESVASARFKAKGMLQLG